VAVPARDLATCELPAAELLIVIAGPASDRAACARAARRLSQGGAVYELVTRGLQVSFA
jgi:hypothetical protein